MNTSSNALIIFQKNILKGKVKTRLAATVGDDNAMAVFRFLVDHTYSIAAATDAHKFLFYSDFIEPVSLAPENFIAMVQEGDSLGERMSNAFKIVFQAGYSNVIIIGTDCYELNASIVNEAFEKMEENDFVVGPAMDGGYYLLGMKQHSDMVFENKQWSTDKVFSDTLKDIHSMGKLCFQTKSLSDIDTEADLGELKRLLAVNSK
jgi:rSAM/selenodomain-associated transferase 1